ncbi:hypothetical protein FPOAC1_011936 [Fusarium poae]|uniref:hypothetical protein n=1 Tax=Fusarium poae TaxID=36050 RepID=UPI001CE9ECDB|nr:hypothetical protein FPOAC1_011936 [Fusarium poae]KAG8667114.1 hypothetical protein FPOAC1_011936 [Fusarium poae]
MARSSEGALMNAQVINEPMRAFHTRKGDAAEVVGSRARGLRAFVSASKMSPGPFDDDIGRFPPSNVHVDRHRLQYSRQGQVGISRFLSRWVSGSMLDACSIKGAGLENNMSLLCLPERGWPRESDRRYE